MDNEPDLIGRVAIVTGGSRGIGRAIAKDFAAKGARVVISYVENHAAAQGVAADIVASGGQAAALQASVDDPQQCAALVAKAVEAFGKLDILVNNAGLQAPMTKIADGDVENLKRLLSVNTIGPYLMCQAAIPELRKQSRSDILFIGSTSSTLTPSMNGLYTMSKAAVEALAGTLAKEEREHNIRVNAVAPTLIPTDMVKDVAALFGVSHLHELDGLSPFGRMGTPEDIASIASYLVSWRNFYISGQRIIVDGAGGSSIAGVSFG